MRLHILHTCLHSKSSPSHAREFNPPRDVKIATPADMKPVRRPGLVTIAIALHFRGGAELPSGGEQVGGESW